VQVSPEVAEEVSRQGEEEVTVVVEASQGVAEEGLRLEEEGGIVEVVEASLEADHREGEEDLDVVVVSSMC